MDFGIRGSTWRRGALLAAALLLTPGVGVADGPPVADAAADTTVSPDPNPTGLLIRPLRGQTPDRQLADERDCYAAACAALDWDPYAAYDELVAAGYAVALDRSALVDGLVSVAMDGAVTGTVAGDLLDDDEERAGEIGAAIAVAEVVVRAGYLLDPEDPEARRAVSRFERELKTWTRKFAACLRPRGYRVRSF